MTNRRNLPQREACHVCGSKRFGCRDLSSANAYLGCPELERLRPELFHPTQQTAMKSETSADIENVEAWAEIIKDVLWHVPPDKRSAILLLATRHEDVERFARELPPGEKIWEWANPSSDSSDSSDWIECPQRVIMRLKALLVQSLVRDIAYELGEWDAAAILFARHPYGSGSGWLKDYLPGQPRRSSS
jgi:hypothetical protein